MRFAAPAAIVVTSLFALSGCKSVQRGGALACVPNEQAACSCGGQAVGFQVCFDDGFSFGECDCQPDGGMTTGGGAGGSGGTGAESGAGSGGTSAAAGSSSGGAGSDGGAGGVLGTSGGAGEAGAGGGGAPPDLGPPPLASWALDEGTGDAISDGSGNGHQGTVFGAVWTTGIRDGGLSFDGADDYVAVPRTPAIVVTTSMTVECWVSLASPNDAVIVGSYRVNSQFDDSYWLHVQEGRFHFSVIGDNLATVTISSPSVAPNDTWTHLVGIFDGAEARLYVDGSLIDSLATSFDTLVDSPAGIGIGNEDDGGPIFPLAGAVDEVRLYDYPRTDAQILSSYRAMLP